MYETLHRFFTEEFAGMVDKQHTPKEPARKVDVKAMAAIRRLQANADLGEFRIHAALAQLGIDLSPRTCGRIMAHNRQLGLPRPADSLPHEPKPMPYAATCRHDYWSVDVRYIEDHQLEQRKPVYVISILESYSRALLASVLSPRQDLTAFLIVLRAALHEHGCPTAIVSDGGSIFKANLVLKIYKELGIERCRIDPGQPWQNYIETHFNIMRRMLDYLLAQAEDWTAMRAGTTASSPTTICKYTSPTGSVAMGGTVPPKCWDGCTACGVTTPNSTASSDCAPNVSSTRMAICATSGGESTGSAAWQGATEGYGSSGRC